MSYPANKAQSPAPQSPTPGPSSRSPAAARELTPAPATPAVAREPTPGPASPAAEKTGPLPGSHWAEQVRPSHVPRHPVTSPVIIGIDH